MASQFPKLPGFVPTYPIEKFENNKKVSAAKQEKNRDKKSTPQILYPLPREQKQQQQDQKRMFHPDYLSSSHSVHQPLNSSEVTEQFLPNYVKLDRHVLRFYGFFKEGAVETRLETQRNRKLIIYYYLEDNSISIIEEKQENSGIPQGQFLNRRQVLKEDGSGLMITAEDFQIGNEIMIFGKNIKILDCDQYTREFYQNLGVDLSNKLQYQPDNFEQTKLTKFQPVKDSMMKDYMEHKLGGGRVKSQKQFLENDRKVLRFFAYSEIPYIIHFYLADDTLEIREINFSNSGYDPFPLYLKRQKLPKKFTLQQPGQFNAEELTYINPSDIKHGEQLNIFGKYFLINGCDQFTQNYFKQKFNYDFPLGQIEQHQSKEQNNIIIPPFNGIGDEEDSLGYIYRLIPKPPKKDYFKWVDNQDQLRYLAKLNSTQPEDVNRKFIITYFLNCDAISIYESQQRNSGMPEGKFLEKKRYKNSERNNEYFSPIDLIVGKDIKINGFSFHILECDDHTRKWMDAQNFK